MDGVEPLLEHRDQLRRLPLGVPFGVPCARQRRRRGLSGAARRQSPADVSVPERRRPAATVGSDRPDLAASDRRGAIRQAPAAAAQPAARPAAAARFCRNSSCICSNDRPSADAGGGGGSTWRASSSTVRCRSGSLRASASAARYCASAWRQRALAMMDFGEAADRGEIFRRALEDVLELGERRRRAR